VEETIGPICQVDDSPLKITQKIKTYTFCNLVCVKKQGRSNRHLSLNKTQIVKFEML